MTPPIYYVKLFTAWLRFVGGTLLNISHTENSLEKSNDKVSKQFLNDEVYLEWIELSILRVYFHKTYNNVILLFYVGKQIRPPLLKMVMSDKFIR